MAYVFKTASDAVTQVLRGLGQRESDVRLTSQLWEALPIVQTELEEEGELWSFLAQWRFLPGSTGQSVPLGADFLAIYDDPREKGYPVLVEDEVYSGAISVPDELSQRRWLQLRKKSLPPPTEYEQGLKSDLPSYWCLEWNRGTGGSELDGLCLRYWPLLNKPDGTQFAVHGIWREPVLTNGGVEENLWTRHAFNLLWCRLGEFAATHLTKAPSEEQRFGKEAGKHYQRLVKRHSAWPTQGNDAEEWD